MNTVELTETARTSESGAAIIHILLRDTLTEERRDFLKAKLNELAEKHDTLRVMLVVEHIDGITLEGGLEAMDIENGDRGDIDKVAVILTSEKPLSASTVSSPMAGDIHTHFFEPGDEDKAMEWLTLS